MYDSQASKPLLLFPILLVAIVVERGWLPDIFSMFGQAFIVLFIVMAALMLIRFFKAHRPRAYVEPKARYIADGVMEVVGDAEWLQHHFHNLTNPSTWIKLGDRHWRVEMPNCNNWQTKDCVQSINGREK